jgi:hypothetical protein
MKHNQPTSHRQSSYVTCLALTTAICITGCVQQYPIPNAVRSGETLVLGLGGIQRNANGNQSLQTDDLQITLTDHAGNHFTLSPQATFKAFPDYASVVNYSAVKGSYLLKPFDGGWFVSIPLVWPWDDQHQGEALPLAVGAGTVAITSSKLTNTALQDLEGNLTSIPIEILPGSADSNKAIAYTQQFGAYTGSKVLSIAPANLNGISSVGGLQLAITYPRSAAYLDANHSPMAIPNSHNPYIQIAQNIVANGDGTNTINVLLTAQKGFSAAANQTPLTPLLSDLTVQIMSFFNDESYTDAQLLADFNIDLAKSYYVDLNGNVMALQPVMTIQN